MKENIHEIITRILSGESTSQDNHDLISWLNLNQENIDEFHEKERVWNAINVVFAKEKYDDKAAYDRFIDGIGRSGRKSSSESVTKRFLAGTLKWAAIGLILIGFGSLFFFISDLGPETEADNYEVIVPLGSRSNLILTDGTSVWLNADSRLSYSKNFGEGDRSVHLEGEGFFQVARDNKHPFTVITSEVEVVALGTSFNVKSYTEEDVIQTTLVSGSIQVNRINHRATEKGLTLEPNQQLTYYRGTRQLSVSSGDSKEDVLDIEKQDKIRRPAADELPRAILRRGVDPEIFTAWKDNRLILDDEPFESIAIKLERRFGTNIIIQDEAIANRRFIGKFDEITMEQALKALQFVSPFDYYMENDTIYISSK
jgi:transmembrane sensor